MTTPIHPQATRRLTLQFSSTGNPYYSTVTSPLSFKQRSLAVTPNIHVIPVIFVPGIMGTNLKGIVNGIKNKPVWRPPNGNYSGWKEGSRRAKQDPAERQRQLNPQTTCVDPGGPIVMPERFYTLTQEEARRRGWGEVHWDSYGKLLTGLEQALNDPIEDVGQPDAALRKVWTIAQTLKKDQTDVRFAWNSVQGDVTPLSSEEYQHAHDYYYPVWACGYNWLQSCEQSAQRLMKKIEEVLTFYRQTHCFIPEGRVLLVTHSMGGLVARRAAQQMENNILGIVHGVQPVGGAPVVYIPIAIEDHWIETERFFRRARRKPQRCPVASRGFTTPPCGKRFGLYQ